MTSATFHQPGREKWMPSTRYRPSPRSRAVAARRTCPLPGSPGLGSAEFLVGVLVACGFLMIGISSLLPKSGDDELEWWER
jgi:hypothetical protein